MNIPTTDKGSFTLLRAEKKTGIIVNNDNTRYLGVEENYYRVFNSLQKIEEYIIAEKKKSNDLFEYSIYDCEGVFIRIEK